MPYVMLVATLTLYFSFKASWLEQKLSPISMSSISAKDILLDEVSSSFDQARVLDQIQTNQQSSSDNNGTCLDRLLIIDDLDVIIGMDLLYIIKYLG